MHTEEIKAAMRMAGKTPAALADDLGVSRSTVSQVMSGRGTSQRIKAAIAQVTGKSVDTLWPPKKQVVLRRKKPVASGVGA